MTAVKLEGVDKTYRALSKRSWFRRSSLETSKVLDGITTSFEEGSTTAVMGGNGAGKSTLLRIVAGVTAPSAGTVDITVPSTGLLNLGSGLLGPLTGRENATTLLMLCGRSRVEASNLLPRVKEYSRLGDYFEKPVRTYSSGMRMRLAFSALVHARPRLLILDEVLAVGDQFFRPQCYESLTEMSRSGDVTLVFTSHDTKAIERLCESAILLEAGRITAQGSTAAVLDAYKSSLPEPVSSSPEDTMTSSTVSDAKLGPPGVLHSEGGSPPAFDGSQSATIHIPARLPRELLNPIMQIAIHRPGETEPVLRCASQTGFGRLSRNGIFAVKLPAVDLPEGRYDLSCTLFSSDWSTRLAFRYRTDHFQADGRTDHVSFGEPEFTARGFTRPPSGARKVFVLSEQRTGSNLFLDLITQHPWVTSAGELLHSGHQPELESPTGGKVAKQLIQSHMDLRPDGCEVRMGKVQFGQVDRSLGITGLSDLIETYSDAKWIVLFRRNLVDQYVSLQRAKQSGEWVREKDGRTRVHEPVELDVTELEEFCRRSQSRYRSAISLLERNSVPHVVMEYEEIVDQLPELLDDVLRPFLEISPFTPESRLRKQRIEPLDQVVKDSDLLSEILGTDWSSHGLATSLDKAAGQ